MKKKKISSGNPLSPEELKMLSSEISRNETDRSQLPPHDNSDRAKAKRFMKKNLFFTVSAVIVVIAILVCSVFGVVALVKKIAARPNTSDYKIYLGNKKQPYTVSYKDAVLDGVLYLDVRKFAAYAGLVVSGSETKIKFTASDYEYLRFEDKSEYAVISGNKVEISPPAIVNAKECLVPYAFLEKALSSGLRLRLDTENNTIRITRQVYEGTTIPAALIFSAGSFTVISSIQKQEAEEISADQYNIDISQWLQYIVPDNPSAYLVLANKQTPLGRDYAPEDLVTLKTLGVTSKDAEQKLCRDAAYALQAMFTAMTAADPAITNGLYVTSSYRTYAYQEALYNLYVKRNMDAGMTREEAEADASRTSARPGESEHQTGLCFDFLTNGGSLDRTFENTRAFAWLRDNAHLYGFILRYPEDKVGITEYDYEPWHYRFVGRDAAVAIYTSGRCLEEYLELT